MDRELWWPLWAGLLALFQDQNQKILNGTISEEGTKYIHLDTLGIINGKIDNSVQLPGYAHMAFNNVSDFKIIHIVQSSGILLGGCISELT